MIMRDIIPSEPPRPGDTCRVPWGYDGASFTLLVKGEGSTPTERWLSGTVLALDGVDPAELMVGSFITVDCDDGIEVLR